MLSNQKLILAVSAAGLPPAFAQRTAFLPMTEDLLWFTLGAAGLWLGPRPQLEDLPAFRQIIPYVALRLGDRFVKYTRTPAGGESRLHGRVSIGLGGHIDLPDVVFRGEGIDLARTLGDAAAREVDEELAGVEVTGRRWIGLLVDNDNPVGRVHIGVVAVWDLAAMPHGAAEDAIGDTGAATLEELRADEARLETWSSLLVRHLGEAAPR
jgi:predicted NUDIX family phosphoesterase